MEKSLPTSSAASAGSVPYTSGFHVDIAAHEGGLVLTSPWEWVTTAGAKSHLRPGVRCPYLAEATAGVPGCRDPPRVWPCEPPISFGAETVLDPQASLQSPARPVLG